MSGIDIPSDAWRSEQLTPHLFAHFRIMDENGKCLDEDSDLASLQARYAGRANRDFQKQGKPAFNEREVTAWDFGDLADSIELSSGAVVMRGFPALEVNDDKIILKLFDHQPTAVKAHREGVLKLFENQVKRVIKDVKRGLPDIRQQCLWFAPLGNCDELTGDIMQAVLAQAFLADNKPVRTEQDFQQRLKTGRQKLMEVANQVGGCSASALAEYHQLSRLLKSKIPPYALPVASEIRLQVDSLVYPGFVSKTPTKWLPHLARFIKAARLRFEKCGANAQRDRQQSSMINKFIDRHEKALINHPDIETLQDFRWLIEELRVSIFAQELKTSVKVSEQRLEKIWREI